MGFLKDFVMSKNGKSSKNKFNQTWLHTMYKSKTNDGPSTFLATFYNFSLEIPIFPFFSKFGDLNVVTLKSNKFGPFSKISILLVENMFKNVYQIFNTLINYVHPYVYE
jgi:hypothetical protein